MNENVTQPTLLMGCLIILSIVVLVSGICLLNRRRSKTGRFSWSGFVLTMFLAVLFYDLGLTVLTGHVNSVLLSVFHALQTMTANRDLELPEVAGLGNGTLRFLVFYGALLFIVAPVSIVSAVLEYFSGAISGVFLWADSCTAESFVFSCLDERTLDLAHDIRMSHPQKGDSSKRACIAFASCRGVEDDLMAEAHRIGARCLDADVEATMKRCSPKTVCSVVILDENEEAAIVLARRLKKRAAKRHTKSGQSETRIFVLTDFRSTEALLFPELLKEELKHDEDASSKVLVRGIDLTRELVEQVILRYPLFLLSKPSGGVSMPVSEAGQATPPARALPWYHASQQDICRAQRKELYDRPDRHILIVGAGSVGTEFLTSALWASRIDGVDVRIDVVDGLEDPLQEGRPYVEARFAAEAPEIMAMRAGAQEAVGNSAQIFSGDEGRERLYDLSFSLIDAETEAYAQFLAKRAETISYVFIALGDDLKNARVAMRTRQILERELARRTKSRDEFLAASRPLVLAVIRDDDFSATVEKAENEGQPYDIICVGNDSDVLTYQMLKDLVGNRGTEYKRRSSRASDTHRKYRFFAFVRNLVLDRHGVRRALAGADAVLAAEGPGGLDTLLDELDWTIDVRGTDEERQRVRGWHLADLYRQYCSNERTRALASTDVGPESTREWLLSMEHDRWNAYVRTQGFVCADMPTVEHIFATGQLDTQKHRSNLMGLHPCLVSFEELTTLDLPVHELYQDYFAALDERESEGCAEQEKRLRTAAKDWFQLLDDKYIGL